MERKTNTPISARLIAAGKGADGNLYCTYVMVYDGFIITTYGAIAADELIMTAMARCIRCISRSSIC